MWRGRVGALLRVWGFWPTGVPRRRLLSCDAASQAGSNSPHCWNCGGPWGPGREDRFFCPQCRALQAPDPTRDYFNRSFRVDTGKASSTGYQQLQRALSTQISFSQRSQGFSEKHSTLVNDAYKTLLPPPEGRGLRFLKGQIMKWTGQFLMEKMEINEKLAEAESEAAMKELNPLEWFSFSAKQKEFTDNVSSAFEQDDFEEAKEILTKMRYFSNIEEKIKLKKIPL
uniref:HscB mitochondrial iron-sulfur cluster cochaperone n=1 Tax=Macaca nemestrina TaxID=9545 RepID=A0A2K6BS85_MACNE